MSEINGVEDGADEAESSLSELVVSDTGSKKEKLPNVLDDDVRLVYLIANGNYEQQNVAVTLLYDRYHAMVKSIIIAVIHDETEAEDVSQEVFLQLIANAASYNHTKGKFAAWLITLSRRRGIDRLRQRHSRQMAMERMEEASHLEFGISPSRHNNTTSNELELKDIQRIFQEVLEEIPAPQKEVLICAKVLGMSQREIAAELRLPLGTVKTRFELGMRRILPTLDQRLRKDPSPVKLLKITAPELGVIPPKVAPAPPPQPVVPQTPPLSRPVNKSQSNMSQVRITSFPFWKGGRAYQDVNGVIREVEQK